LRHSTHRVEVTILPLPPFTGQLDIHADRQSPGFSYAVTSGEAW
jgi:hypothetical protein